MDSLQSNLHILKSRLLEHHDHPEENTNERKSIKQRSPEKPISLPSWKDQGFMPMRYVVTSMAFLAGMLQYMMRLNINFGIVAMVKPINDINLTNNTKDDICGFTDLDEEDKEDYAGEFEWDQWTQGLILGSFFWGYIWTQAPGGRLAEVVGAHLVMGWSLVGSAICSLLIPIAAQRSYILLIVLRVALGLFQGAVYPACHVLFTHWVPPLERSWLTAVRHTGNTVGIVIIFPISASLIQTVSWQAIFYVPGCVTLIWVVCWFFLVSDRPGTNRWITQVEKDYIVQSVGDSKHHKALRVPIKSILTSLPVWAIIVAGLGDSWGFHTMMSNLPLYMKNVLKKDIKSNGLNSALPYLGYMMYSLLVGNVGDRLRRKGTISTIAFRKIATAAAHLVPAVMLFSLSLVECNRDVTLALFFIAVTFQGGAITGFTTNIMDIAPNYAGTVYGIQNALANVPGFIVPMMVGAIVTNQQSIPQWRTVFNIGGTIYLVETMFYLIFASGQEQDWNKKYDNSQCDGNSVSE